MSTALASTARADPSGASEPRAVVAPEPIWYGEQAIAADALGAMAFLAGGALVAQGTANQGQYNAGNATLVTGMFAIGLGAPIVHAAHGRWSAALTSFGMRALALTAAAGLGALLALGGGEAEPPRSPSSSPGARSSWRRRRSTPRRSPTRVRRARPRPGRGPRSLLLRSPRRSPSFEAAPPWASAARCSEVFISPAPAGDTDGRTGRLSIGTGRSP